MFFLKAVFAFVGITSIFKCLYLPYIHQNNIDLYTWYEGLGVFGLAVLYLTTLSSMPRMFSNQPMVAINTARTISVAGFVCMGLTWSNDIAKNFDSRDPGVLWEVICFQAAFFSLNFVYYYLRKKEMEELELPTWEQIQALKQLEKPQTNHKT